MIFLSNVSISLFRYTQLQLNFNFCEDSLIQAIEFNTTGLLSFGSPWLSPVRTSLLSLKPQFLISTCHWDHGSTFDIISFTCCCAEQHHTVSLLAPSSKKGMYLEEFARWWKCSPRTSGENRVPLPLTRGVTYCPWCHWCPDTNTNTLLFPRWQFPEGFGFFLFLMFLWQSLRHSDLVQHSGHPMNSSSVEFWWTFQGIFFHLGGFFFTINKLYYL